METRQLLFLSIGLPVTAIIFFVAYKELYKHDTGANPIEAFERESRTHNWKRKTGGTKKRR